MITVYAIIASLLLGGFVRHNYSEMCHAYRVRRSLKKFDREFAKNEKKRKEAEVKIEEAPSA